MDGHTQYEFLQHEEQSNLGCADVELVHASGFQCTLYVITTIFMDLTDLTDQTS